eukprot:symbB.v1.2.015575.t1/scaffold1170.1/size134091/1
MDEVEEATEALLAWGQQALDAAHPKVEMGLPSHDGMKLLRQEVEELEAQVALFGERQVLECRLSAVCEAQVVEAQMEAELQPEREELSELEAQVAQTLRSWQRCQCRSGEVLRFLKGMPAAEDENHWEEEIRKDQEEQHQLLEMEATLHTEHEVHCGQLRQEIAEEEIRGESVIAHWRQRLSLLEVSASEIDEKAKEYTALRSTAATLRERLEQCNSRVEDLEALTASCSKVLQEQSIQLEELERDSAVLHQELEEDHRYSTDQFKLELQERDEELTKQMKYALEVGSDSAEDALEQSKKQKVKLQEIVANVASHLHILEQCQELQRSSSLLSDQSQSVSRAQESLIQRRDALKEEIHETHDAEAKVQEQTVQELAVHQLQSELQLAEKAMIHDLHAQLAARERRVQLLAQRFRSRTEKTSPMEVKVG